MVFNEKKQKFSNNTKERQILLFYVRSWTSPLQHFFDLNQKNVGEEYPKGGNAKQ